MFFIYYSYNSAATCRWEVSQPTEQLFGCYSLSLCRRKYHIVEYLCCIKYELCMHPMLEVAHPFILKCTIYWGSFSHILDHANYRLTKNNQSDLVDRWFQSLGMTLMMRVQFFTFKLPTLPLRTWHKTHLYMSRKCLKDYKIWATLKFLP